MHETCSHYYNLCEILAHLPFQTRKRLAVQTNTAISLSNPFPFRNDAGTPFLFGIFKAPYSGFKFKLRGKLAGRLLFLLFASYLAAFLENSEKRDAQSQVLLIVYKQTHKYCISGLFPVSGNIITPKVKKAKYQGQNATGKTNGIE